ncbi:Ankyrin repeat domain containing protein [Pandoravirus neocaledonia]|uniref:Ankyrin repeat domain containing protein n=1 Tax=Pandoravirus neocaledonia TaxID=2107708 RepID=A0A2U7UDZ3_9VIRU|nr:Ankyrin repeat domain containing protein [Pandoravirus neocaledonia]AVK76653.1 Ankyrin repeat domain containing protein [Pandoravirus neocaledonia]
MWCRAAGQSQVVVAAVMRKSESQNLSAADDGAVGIGSMPTEILCGIIDRLDDVSFCTVRVAHRMFRVHTADEIHRGRQVPRWLCADRIDLCRRGDVTAVRALCDHGAPFALCHLAQAAASGHLDVVLLLHRHRLCTHNGHFADAKPHDLADAQNSMQEYFVTADGTIVDRFGNPIVRTAPWWWSSSCASPPPTDAMDLAAAAGHLAIVQFLHANRTEGCTTRAMDGAAAGGHSDVIKFLHANRSEGCTARAIFMAARHGHFDVIAFLHEIMGMRLARPSLVEAIVHGHRDIVAYFYRRGIRDCRSGDMDKAARNGHLAVVRFLDKKATCGCTIQAMTLAALSGHLDVVVYLHKNRTEGCTTKALASRNPQVVAFLRQHYEVVDGTMMRVKDPRRRPTL